MSWAFKRLESLVDEDINDVHLVGTDGEEVPCCKAYLAPMSPVFRNMFYRGFKEEMTDRCSLGFHSLVISVIVKYCYCGEVDVDDIMYNFDKSLEDETSLLVELREAGRYFEIEDLSLAAEAEIANLVFDFDDKRKYQYASACLTELFKRGEDVEPLGLLLYKFADKNMMECFGVSVPENENSTDIHHVHPCVLANALENHEDDYAVVRCLQTWFSFESSSAGNGYSDEDKQELIDIAEDIDLKKLSTTQLSEIRPCSLFPSERILEAFVHHHKSREIIAEMPRTVPCLHVSGAAMECLNGSYKQVLCGGSRMKVAHVNTVFSREVKHNGISCLALIHCQYSVKKWFISITKSETLFMKGDGGVDSECIRTFVYDASCKKLHPFVDSKFPPFNGWKSTQGTDPVPFVACIYE